MGHSPLSLLNSEKSRAQGPTLKPGALVAVFAGGKETP